MPKIIFIKEASTIFNSFYQGLNKEDINFISNLFHVNKNTIYFILFEMSIYQKFYKLFCIRIFYLFFFELTRSGKTEVILGLSFY